MRKLAPMSFRKFFVVTAAIAALGVAAGAAIAQTSQQKAMIDTAKSQGTVVQVTNAARREAYARSGQAAGTTADVAGARMFEGQLLPRISTGQWYRNAQGQWVQR